MVIASGDHEWRASATGIGAIDALYRAVDKALAGVLTGHPRLLAYDIHALGEGTDTVGAVTVRIAPPDIGGERGSGEYVGEARGPNIIAASIEAYITALNALLAEAHWEGATEAAGNRRGVAVSAGAAREQRADLDEDEGPERHDGLVRALGRATRRGRPGTREEAAAVHDRGLSRVRPARLGAMAADLPIAYAGEPGAFAEDAVIAAFGDVARVSLGSFRESFDAVAAGDAAAGVVPIENVINGTVRENYDLLLEHDLQIRGEVVVPVALCLAALPGQSLDDIERVYSHIQALGQAEGFLRGRPWQLLTTYNTAGAGKAIADRGERGAAAVLSPRAAALFGLEILADEIGDLPGNRTRFLVLGTAGRCGPARCCRSATDGGRPWSSRSATSPGPCWPSSGSSPTTA